MGYPSPYALIALDLDGTTVKSDGTVSASVKEAVQECIRRHIAVIIATGRMPQSAKRYWEELNLPPGPLVAFQGAMVVWVPEGRIQSKVALPDGSARRVVKWALEQDLLIQVYVGTELWVSREDPRVRRYIDANHIPAWVLGPDEIIDWPEAPIKVLLQDDARVLDRLRGDLQNRLNADPVRIFKSQADYLEVVNVDVGKAKGLKAAAQALGIPREQVLAIGDAENDIDMLTWAGLGIAMGQAPDVVKRASDGVTDSIGADGAARALEKWVLS